MRVKRGVVAMLAAWGLSLALGGVGAASFAGQPADYPPVEPTVTPLTSTVTPAPTDTPTAVPTPTPTPTLPVVPPAVVIDPGVNTVKGIVAGLMSMRPDSWVVVRWCRILGPHGSEDDEYQASPRGCEDEDYQPCRTTQQQVDANGAVNFVLPTSLPGSYQVTFTGTAANGLPFTQTVVIMVSLPSVNVRASAVSKHSKLRVTVITKCPGRGQWPFRVQKARAAKKSSAFRYLGVFAATKWTNVGSKHNRRGHAGKGPQPEEGHLPRPGLRSLRLPRHLQLLRQARK